MSLYVVVMPYCSCVHYTDIATLWLMTVTPGVILVWVITIGRYVLGGAPGVIYMWAIKNQRIVILQCLMIPSDYM